MAGPLPSFSLLEDEVERKPKISDSDGEDIDFPPGEEDGDEDELVQEEDDDDEMEDGIVGAGTGLFNIQNRIKRAKHGSMSIRDLYQMICDKRINLNPPYQREAVWTQPRQVGLVDSIFVGAAIPALVFSVTTGNDGQERRNVIDGKQRLTTISRFMAGEFPYRNKKNTRNKSYYWKMKPGVSNKATSFRVPPEEKTWFEETHIPCIDFHDIAIEQEEDIFTRIQQGMVLAGGEKTSVGTTPRKEFIKDLVKTFFRSPTSPVPHLIDIDISRKRDFTDLTAFVYCCEGLPQDRVKPTLEAQRNWLERKDDLSKGFRKQITDAMDDFWRIVEHHNHPFITVAQRVAPVEFCFIGVYFFVTHGQGIEDDVLADEVLQMRKRCHSEFPGVVKMNSTLFQWWWKELDDIAARPENGHQRLPYLIDPIGTAPAKTTTRQRKVKPRRNEVATRAVEDEDREDEMDVDTVPTQQVENPRRTPQRGSPSTSGPSIQKRPRTVSNGLDSEAGSPSKVGPPAHWGPLKSAKGSTSYASPLKKARLTGDQFVAYKVRSRSQSPGI